MLSHYNFSSLELRSPNMFPMTLSLCAVRAQWTHGLSMLEWENLSVPYEITDLDLTEHLRDELEL